MQQWGPSSDGGGNDEPAGSGAALWIALLKTGLRRSEVVGLQWGDVDLDEGTLSVHRAVTAVRGEAVETGGKTDAATRTLTLGDLAGVLHRHRVQLAEQRLARGGDRIDSGHVFTKADGSRLHPKRVTARFTSLTEAMGLPRIGVHGLRHTHATMLLLNGAPPLPVSQRLGHASPSITLNIYAHALPAWAVPG